MPFLRGAIATAVHAIAPPAYDAVVNGSYRGAEGARVVIRPSGTEPKLKAYLEVVVDGPDKAGAAAALARLRSEIAALMGA